MMPPLLLILIRDRWWQHAAKQEGDEMNTRFLGNNMCGENVMSVLNVGVVSQIGVRTVLRLGRDARSSGQTTKAKQQASTPSPSGSCPDVGVVSF